MGKIKTRERNETILIRLIFAAHHSHSEQYVFCVHACTSMDESRKRTGHNVEQILKQPVFNRKEGTKSFYIIP